MTVRLKTVALGVLCVCSAAVFFCKPAAAAYSSAVFKPAADNDGSNTGKVIKKTVRLDTDEDEVRRITFAYFRYHGKKYAVSLSSRKGDSRTKDDSGLSMIRATIASPGCPETMVVITAQVTENGLSWVLRYKDQEYRQNHRTSSPVRLGLARNIGSELTYVFNIHSILLILSDHTLLEKPSSRSLILNSIITAASEESDHDIYRQPDESKLYIKLPDYPPENRPPLVVGAEQLDQDKTDREHSRHVQQVLPGSPAAKPTAPIATADQAPQQAASQYFLPVAGHVRTTLQGLKYVTTGTAKLAYHGIKWPTKVALQTTKFAFQHPKAALYMGTVTGVALFQLYARLTAAEEPVSNWKASFYSLLKKPPVVYGEGFTMKSS